MADATQYLLPKGFQFGATKAGLKKRGRTDFYKLLSRYRLLPNDFKKAPPENHDEVGDGSALLDAD